MAMYKTQVINKNRHSVVYLDGISRNNGQIVEKVVIFLKIPAKRLPECRGFMDSVLLPEFHTEAVKFIKYIWRIRYEYASFSVRK